MTYIPPDTKYALIAIKDDENLGYILLSDSECIEKDINNEEEAAKYFANEVFWGSYGGAPGEEWEIIIKVHNGKVEQIFKLMSFINNDDCFEFKIIE